MRVLIVTPSLPTPRRPSELTFVKDQIDSLVQKGLDLNILVLDRGNLGQAAYARIGSLLRSRVRSDRPDIVHFMYGGVMAALGVRSVLRIPKIVSFCGIDLLGARYGSRFFQLRTAIGRAASLYAASRADGIIVKSRNLREGLPRHINMSRVWILPNGVDFNLFKPMKRHHCRSELGWPSDVFIILFSTSDHRNRKKRLPLALQAVQELTHRGTHAEIRGLDNLPHDRIPTFLNAADVLLLTSQKDEGSPNIVKEALACNRPVVSLDVGDVAERLDGIEGCFITSESPVDIADGLERALRYRDGVESRTRIADISIERIADRLIDIYQTVLAQSAT